MKLLALLLLAVFHSMACYAQDGTAMRVVADDYREADSLQLALLDLEVQKARIELDRSGIWQRCLPRITLSASIGLKNAFFYDQETVLQNIWPTDAVRLSVSLSVNDIFDVSKAPIAEIMLSSAVRRYDLECARIKSKHRETVCQLNQLRQDSAYLAQLIALKERVAQFNESRFSQGTITFEALTSSRLELHARTHEFEELLAAIQKIEHALSHGGTK